MSLILQIETSTKNCSVALSKEGELLDSIDEYNEKYSHDAKLHVFIDDILNRNNLKSSDLNAICVSKGPGSYTGLRIGVTAAKGLAYALQIPLLSTESLEALVYSYNEKADFIIPMIDARRMEAYTSVFNKNYKQIQKTEATILTNDSFKEFLEKGKVAFIGNKTEKFKTIHQHKNAIYCTESHPSAKDMTKLAFIKFENRIFDDIAYFEPYYVKDFKTN